MKRIFAVASALLVIGAGMGESAWAQIPQYQSGPPTGTGGPTLRPSTRPVVSSYAGLLGSGVGANSAIGYQYFTRVQPQIAANRALGTLGRSVNRLQAEALSSGGLSGLSPEQQLLGQTPASSTGIGPTGHPVGYMSHLAYFGTNLQRSSGASGGSAAPSARSNPVVPGRH